MAGENKNPITFACRDWGRRTEWVLSLFNRVAEIPVIGMWCIWVLTSKEEQPKDQPKKVVGRPEYRQKHNPGWELPHWSFCPGGCVHYI